MPISLEKDTEVITSDGKKIGKVKRIENEDYFIVYKKGLLTDEEIRERMSGNICRCGAYPGIVAAIREVSGQASGRGV